MNKHRSELIDFNENFLHDPMPNFYEMSDRQLEELSFIIKRVLASLSNHQDLCVKGGLSWQLTDLGRYLSLHVLTKHSGDWYPKFCVISNPDGPGWLIGQYFPFVGEYVPIEQDENINTLVFATAGIAMRLIDQQYNDK